MKSGIGSYAVQIGELQVGAVVAVNALGISMTGRMAEKRRGFCREQEGISGKQKS